MAQKNALLFAALAKVAAEGRKVDFNEQDLRMTLEALVLHGMLSHAWRLLEYVQPNCIVFI